MSLSSTEPQSEKCDAEFDKTRFTKCVSELQELLSKTGIGGERENEAGERTSRNTSSLSSIDDELFSTSVSPLSVSNQPSDLYDQS